MSRHDGHPYTCILSHSSLLSFLSLYTLVSRTSPLDFFRTVWIGGLRDARSLLVPNRNRLITTHRLVSFHLHRTYRSVLDGHLRRTCDCYHTNSNPRFLLCCTFQDQAAKTADRPGILFTRAGSGRFFTVLHIERTNPSWRHFHTLPLMKNRN